MKDLGLSSVCVEAACPNKCECWAEKHVTFLILGDTCTRGCSFCDVTGGVPSAPDPSEPEKIATATQKLGLKYVVITSVTRDDLEDKGTDHFVETTKRVNTKTPETRVELLIPDLDADMGLLREIATSGADVVGHNIEMPDNLYEVIRPKANYQKGLSTLKILSALKKEGVEILVKSSLILGLGETEDDIYRTLEDLKNAGVDIVYLGQYLSPSKDHCPVKKYYTPDEFGIFKEKAKSMGFGAVASGPLVRSSYHASKAYSEANARGQAPRGHPST